MAERRSSQRVRALKGARIVINKGNSTISCTVRSLSAKGALLAVDSIGGIPDEFPLIFDDGRKAKCVVKRRTAKTIAVLFH